MPNRDDLNKMTVVNLKALIKDKGKKLPSSIKLKGDIIDYILSLSPPASPIRSRVSPVPQRPPSPQPSRVSPQRRPPSPPRPVRPVLPEGECDPMYGCDDDTKACDARTNKCVKIPSAGARITSITLDNGKKVIGNAATIKQLLEKIKNQPKPRPVSPPRAPPSPVRVSPPPSPPRPSRVPSRSSRVKEEMKEGECDPKVGCDDETKACDARTNKCVKIPSPGAKITTTTLKNGRKVIGNAKIIKELLEQIKKEEEREQEERKLKEQEERDAKLALQLQQEEEEESDVESGSEEEESDVESGSEPEESDVESGSEPEESDVESGSEPEESDVESGSEPEESDVESGSEPEESDVESGSEPEESDVESGSEEEEGSEESGSEPEESEWESDFESEPESVGTDFIGKEKPDGLFIEMINDKDKDMKFFVSYDPRMNVGYLKRELADKFISLKVPEREGSEKYRILDKNGILRDMRQKSRNIVLKFEGKILEDYITLLEIPNLKRGSVMKFDFKELTPPKPASVDKKPSSDQKDFTPPRPSSSDKKHKPESGQKLTSLEIDFTPPRSGDSDDSDIPSSKPSSERSDIVLPSRAQESSEDESRSLSDSGSSESESDSDSESESDEKAGSDVSDVSRESMEAILIREDDKKEVDRNADLRKIIRDCLIKPPKRV